MVHIVTEFANRVLKSASLQYMPASVGLQWRRYNTFHEI